MKRKMIIPRSSKAAEKIYAFITEFSLSENKKHRADICPTMPDKQNTKDNPTEGCKHTYAEDTKPALNASLT